MFDIYISTLKLNWYKISYNFNNEFDLYLALGPFSVGPKL